MSEPLFDPSLKKKKKKAVAFTEDPLGAEADPTAPAPDTIESTTISGEVVDLGPKTAHEQMMAASDEGGKAKEEGGDDFKAMFGDVKKKKKKKEIPLDFVCLLMFSNMRRLVNLTCAIAFCSFVILGR
jgi:translation initiation factor 2 subunit 2